MPDVRGLKCPNCGAAIELRALEHAVNVVCVQCLSVLDAKDPNLQVLQQFSHKEREKPLIPLGTRGKLHGDAYEAIGFQVRTIYVEGEAYSWAEYLLFNPFKGFRYLTEYNGHWNDVKPLKSLPEFVPSGEKPAVKLLGETYQHFQTATAETTFVMGEFPWQVRVGERVEASDFIAPPRILSREKTEAEATWSLGEYMPGARVWEAFGLPESPPAAAGVFANQPSPYKERVRGMWVAFGALAAALLLAVLLTYALKGRQDVFRERYTHTAGPGRSGTFTTKPFEVKGRQSNLEMEIRTDLTRDLVYFEFALIDPSTGQTRRFGKEAEGQKRDTHWQEGRPHGSVTLPSVPSGRYYLLVEAETPPAVRSVSYELRLRRDVPVLSAFWIAAFLIVIPPAFASLRAATFERSRWAESDYAPESSESDDDDDDSGDDGDDE